MECTLTIEKSHLVLDATKCTRDDAVPNLRNIPRAAHGKNEDTGLASSGAQALSTWILNFLPAFRGKAQGYTVDDNITINRSQRTKQNETMYSATRGEKR